MLSFELPQLLDQLIVFLIGDFGTVFEVIEVFVTTNFVAQSFYLVCDGRFLGQVSSSASLAIQQILRPLLVSRESATYKTGAESCQKFFPDAQGFFFRRRRIRFQ